MHLIYLNLTNRAGLLAKSYIQKLAKMHIFLLWLFVNRDSLLELMCQWKSLQNIFKALLIMHLMQNFTVQTAMSDISM